MGHNVSDLKAHLGHICFLSIPVDNCICIHLHLEHMYRCFDTVMTNKDLMLQYGSVFLILQKYATHKCIHYLAMVVHIFGLLNNV